MAAHKSAHTSAGDLAPGLSTEDEVCEYEKILKISGDIFSGVHPRLKVPSQFIRKRAPKVVTSSPQLSRPALPRDSPDRRTLPTTKGKCATAVPSSADGKTIASTADQSPRAAIRPPSEINPIFLTKSEELVRAEIQLQRGRVERALREQLEQRRQDSRQKAALQDLKPDFDVYDSLIKALKMVPPDPSSEAHGPTKAPSDSLDENSLYSSRAPDSPPSARRKPSPPVARPGSLTTDVPVDHYASELQRLEALNNSASDQEMLGIQPAAKQRVFSDRQPQYKPQEDHAMENPAEDHRPVDVFDEPEYSPPAPGVPPMGQMDSSIHQSASTSHPKRYELDEGLQADGRHGEHRSAMSPLSDVKDVRSYVTSLAAPRPSRMSTLATARGTTSRQVKDSQLLYDADRWGTERYTDRDSPDDSGAAQQFVPKKRRRIQEPRDRPYRIPPRKQIINTSEPYIKQEPVSPPPFTDDPPDGRSRPHRERPIYIDIVSPRYTPVADQREPAVREVVYEADPYEAPVDHGVVRTASRLSVRRSVRDDQDLRRVASLQYARQPEYSREYVERRSPRPMQPMRYGFIDRMPRGARYYDEFGMPYMRRYIPVDEPHIFPGYRETYADEDIRPPIIVPSQRRIVVDEQGNQYYEILPAPRVQTMRPSYARVCREDPLDDHASLWQRNVRARSVVQDSHSDRRYAQEMLPPTKMYRRAMDHTRYTPSERQVYGIPLDDRDTVSQGSSIRVNEYPASRAIYIDEGRAPRETVVRMSSVRPGVVRYEEPREMAQHAGNMQRNNRAMSTYLEDKPQQARGYVARSGYADV